MELKSCFPVFQSTIDEDVYIKSNLRFNCYGYRM
jgi:hypothetical protein